MNLLSSEISKASSESDLVGRTLELITQRWRPAAMYFAVPSPEAESRYQVYQKSTLGPIQNRTLTDFITRLLNASPDTISAQMFEPFASLRGIPKHCIRSPFGERRILMLYFGQCSEVDVLQSICHVVGIQLSNFRLSEIMHRRTRNLLALHDSADSVSRQTFNVQSLMETITREAIALVGIDAAAVLLPEDETRLNYVVRAQTGFSDGNLPLSPGLFSNAFGEFQANPKKAILYHGVAGQIFFLVPLLQTGVAEAVLFLYAKDPNFQLTEDQTQIAEIFGDWASMAIKSATMFERVSNSQREWENTFDSIAEPIYIIDNEFHLKKMNKSLAAFAMKSIRLPENRNCYRYLFHRTTICPWCPVPKAMQSDETVTVEAPLFSTGIWQIHSFPFTDKSKQRIGSIHVLRDVTLLKTMQEQLIESEKLASAGKLISGVAHEVRNPLFGISTTVRALANELGNKEELKPFLDIVTTETTRLNRLMEELLGYSRPVQIDKNPSDITEIVKEVIRQFEHVPTGQNAGIRLFISDTIPPISMDSNKIKQVLINLIENGIQHSGENPQIEVFLEYLSLSSPPEIQLVIKDHGKGIPPANLNRVFDPFFTTRQKGTGLGLSIVRKVIHDHGGRIGLESHLGVGTTFRIAIPATHAKT